MAVIFLFVAAVSSVWSDSVLTPFQRQRAEKLYPQFIAPCCWRQSVAAHQSAQAIHVRAEIDEGIVVAKSDDQIKSELIGEYGHGILMEPEGLRAIIAYAGPILALGVGLFAMLKWIKKNVKPPEIRNALE